MPELDLTRVSKLEKQLDDIVSKEDVDEYELKESFITVLKDACALIRDAESQGVTNLGIAIEQVDKLIDKALDFTHGDDSLYDYVPSFAHSNECPVLEDETMLCMWKDCRISSFEPPH
jgi:hypothetical protein